MRDRVTGVLAGGCELRLDSPGTAACSYWVYPGHRGRGLAARALTLAVDHAFTDLGVFRAELLIEVANTVSHRVAAAAGFHREGVLRGVFDHQGGRYDAVSWSRLPTRLTPGPVAAGVSAGR